MVYWLYDDKMKNGKFKFEVGSLMLQRLFTLLATRSIL